MLLLLSTSSAGMSDDLKGTVITALITGVISIIGFIVTNMSMRKSFKNELLKQRDNIALEKMSAIPFDVLELMDRLMGETNNEENAKESEKFKKMMNGIYSYGSEKAIEIVALMQKENYAAGGNVDNLDKHRLAALYVLLATQIKFDVTGVCVNPEFWFRMRITDYEENKGEIQKATNKLIKELDLNTKMRIS